MTLAARSPGETAGTSAAIEEMVGIGREEQAILLSSKLSKTNPHLRDPVARERAILKSVASSSAIEGIRAPFKGSGSAQGKSAAKTLKRKG